MTTETGGTSLIAFSVCRNQPASLVRGASGICGRAQALQFEAWNVYLLTYLSPPATAPDVFFPGLVASLPKEARGNVPATEGTIKISADDYATLQLPIRARARRRARPRSIGLLRREEVRCFRNCFILSP